MDKTLEQILVRLKSADRGKVKPQILAVSKLQSSEKIRDLFAQGQRLFAENYAQEALAKKIELSDLPIEWHFIGRLQKNKAKDVVGQFHLLHSIDSLDLAQVVDRQAQNKKLTQKIFLQVNLSGELTKGGFDEASLLEAVSDLQQLKHIEICGLMTMPPLFDSPEDSRPYFQRLRSLRDQLLPKIPSCTALSMGTSSDFSIAVEEGATLVRLGTILFGERAKK